MSPFSRPSTSNDQPSTVFIPARVTDNQYNNPEYRKVLESLNGWQKRAWLDGDWDLAAGQYFTTFRRDIHIVTDPPAKQLKNSQPSTFVRPRLFIHQRCRRLIETLPNLQHDPNRPEDVLKVDADEDGVGGDDAADALRYLVATKARRVVQRKLRGL